MGIKEWRAEIDVIDNELLRLINRRVRLAVRVGTVKRRAGLPLSDPDREREVLARAQEINVGPLDDRAVARIFRRIIHESRRVQSGSEETLEVAQEVLR
ncbi:MAG TPA: chorismate mutase [Pyrinomonadaceae bacterium]|nr:chorismate mutase [Pyrinomonadaceae bacterium]